MKIKQLLFAFAMLSLAIGFNSCKKNNETISEEFENTFEASGNQAVSDNLTEDANDMFLQVADENNIAGGFTAGGPVIVNDFIPCATVTITPLSGFPKTIIIDFGTSCTDNNGNVRSGKINITLSDSVRKNGSVAVMTFTNYFINGFKIEGTNTWTNTSIAPGRSWTRRTENGKITAPGGRWWTHYGLRTVVQTAGVATPIRIDDIFSITGTHTVVNSSNIQRDITVLEALIKKTACANIDNGKLKVQGPNHYAVIDFGYGTPCDNLAALSIDGRAPRTITLR
ncbi:MAG: hypothetical protein WAT20_03030 [Ferruginibacter sp.]